MSRGGHVAQPSQAAEIVHAFEYDQIFRTGLRENIAIKACEHIRPQAICEQVVPADTLIEHADSSRSGGRLQSLGQNIGPAVIAVWGGAVTIGDGIPERHN